MSRFCCLVNRRMAMKPPLPARELFAHPGIPDRTGLKSRRLQTNSEDLVVALVDRSLEFAAPHASGCKTRRSGEAHVCGIPLPMNSPTHSTAQLSLYGPPIFSEGKKQIFPCTVSAGHVSWRWQSIQQP